jgi:hypothetical protein
VEAGLFEVVVVGEGGGDSALVHHDEGDAIGERPPFVRALAIQPQPKFKELVISFDNFHGGICSEVTDEQVDISSLLCFGKSIGDFEEGVFRRHERCILGGTGGDGLLVVGVSAVQERNEIERVGEDYFHFFLPLE